MSSNSSIHKTLVMILFLFCTPFLFVSAIQLEKQAWGRQDKQLNVYVGSEDCHDMRSDRPAVLIQKARAALRSLENYTFAENQKPTAASALWDGQRCYFASSGKGWEGEVLRNSNIPNVVRTALRECAAPPNSRATDNMHQFSMRCGEVMVISKWFRDHQGHERLPDSKLIVTVDARGVKAPCWKDKREWVTFGCREFLPKMGFSPQQIIDRTVVTAVRGRAHRGGAKHKRSVLLRSRGWNTQ